MFFFAFVVCCVCSGLCDEPVTSSEESHQMCVCVCDLETSKRGGHGPSCAVVLQKEEKAINTIHCDY